MEAQARFGLGPGGLRAGFKAISTFPQILKLTVFFFAQSLVSKIASTVDLRGIYPNWVSDVVVIILRRCSITLSHNLLYDLSI